MCTAAAVDCTVRAAVFMVVFVKNTIYTRIRENQGAHGEQAEREAKKNMVLWCCLSAKNNYIFKYNLYGWFYWLYTCCSEQQRRDIHFEKIRFARPAKQTEYRERTKMGILCARVSGKIPIKIIWNEKKRKKNEYVTLIIYSQQIRCAYLSIFTSFAAVYSPSNHPIRTGSKANVNHVEHNENRPSGGNRKIIEISFDLRKWPIKSEYWKRWMG